MDIGNRDWLNSFILFTCRPWRQVITNGMGAFFCAEHSGLVWRIMDAVYPWARPSNASGFSCLKIQKHSNNSRFQIKMYRLYFFINIKKSLTE